jgi:hypothetical protein
MRPKKIISPLGKIIRAIPTHGWWSTPFIICELALVTYGFTTFHGPLGPITYAEPLRPFLIGADITVAVFAVNFSLLSVQLSPYRGVLRDLSPRLIAGAALTLLFALLPIVTTAFSANWTATVALLALPPLAYMVVFLSVNARTLASAKPQIERLSSNLSLKEFIERFGEAARTVDSSPPELIKSDGTPPPVHEMGWRIYPVEIGSDPFNELCTIAALAADSGDLPTYIESIRSLLKSVEYLHETTLNRKNMKVFPAGELLRRHGAEALNRVGAIRPAWDNAGTIAHRFNHTCAAFLSTNDLSVHPRSSLALMITKAMAIVSKALIRTGLDEAAVDTVVVARRIALSGSKNSPDELLSGIEHRNTLAGHARIMHELGEQAITHRNTHLLYRCLDGLGFLGCSAAKADNTELGTACLLGLVQLGRLARKGELPCFWDRCALTVEDHAEERIKWIASWTPKLGEERRERWRHSVSDALSRLLGFSTSVFYVEKEGTWSINYKYSEEPYRYSINDNGRCRSYDFSDATMVREFVIH